MKTASNFMRLPDASETKRVEVYFEGKMLELVDNANLAASLLESGIRVFRHTAKGSPRGPFCMMGSCFECLVTIDGESKQACMEKVSAGMKIGLGGGDEDV